jgi:hypothetical protein
MSKGTKPDSVLFLPREAFNSLVSALDYFVATETQIGETFFSKHATRLKAKILKHGRVCKKNDSESVSLFCYGIESAMLIKLLTYYIGLGEKPTADYFLQLEKQPQKKAE